jgi:hypothetical protein
LPYTNVAVMTNILINHSINELSGAGSDHAHCDDQSSEFSLRSCLRKLMTNAPELAREWVLTGGAIP